METNLGIILLTLFFLFVLTGTEVAYLLADKLKIEYDKKQRVWGSGIVSVFAKNSDKFLISLAITFIITLCFFIANVYALNSLVIKLSRFYGAVLLITEFLFITFIILFFCIFLPFYIIGKNPNRALIIFAFPAFILYLILYPVTSVIIWFVSRFSDRLKRTEKNKKANQNVFSKSLFENILIENQFENTEISDNDHDIKMFRNALDFPDIKIRECIIPRNEVVAIDLKSSIEQLKDLFIETGYSKILIYEDSIDNITGYIHCQALFKENIDFRQDIVPLIIVPETMNASKLLDILIKERKSLALVVDEFGGTAGIVTLEDVMEEIFGEIEDEHDRNELIEKQIDEKIFHFSGRLEIDFINEKYYLNLPVSEDYETIAGLVLSHHGTIPEEGDEILIHPFLIKILKVEKPRIELLQIKKIFKD